MSHQQDRPSYSPLSGVVTRIAATGAVRSYVRFAALGDSVTYGIGDNRRHGDRGWASLLAGAMGQAHDVSFHKTARPGATAADVRAEQLEDALAHRPHIASLVVGLNDTMRSTWDADCVRADLLYCAERLVDQGAMLLTVRFHDHTRVFGLPQVLARPMRARIAILNEIYEEIHDRFGGVRIDLAAHPGIYDREFWSVDRLHPSELGHRVLADEFAAHLHAAGLVFDAPGLQLDGPIPGRLENVQWMVTAGAPWLARRARDLGPAVARKWFTRVRAEAMPAPRLASA
jgi:lysophospholipase L1-like esterase